MLLRRNVAVLLLMMLWGTSAYGAEESMAMPTMQGGVAPANARDPHAYSDGYDFAMQPRMEMADEEIMSGLLINRLERVKNSKDLYSSVYELQGWIGKDYERLVIKAEGDVSEDKLQDSRTELLWSHAVSAYWNTQLGIRHDRGVSPSQNWLAFGVQGLAPYWFDMDVTAYVAEQGHTALRLSAEYELLLTQKLILQPRFEANIYGAADDAREIGSGLSNTVAGVRMRYEIKREFAPYIGIDWTRKYGRTAEHAELAGANAQDTNLVAGLRVWF